MSNDFENYMKEYEGTVAKISQQNADMLALFETSMASLSDKTIKKHISNVD